LIYAAEYNTAVVDKRYAPSGTHFRNAITRYRICLGALVDISGGCGGGLLPAIGEELLEVGDRHSRVAVKHVAQVIKRINLI
jgi:hypothetical protein